MEESQNQIGIDSQAVRKSVDVSEGDVFVFFFVADDFSLRYFEVCRNLFNRHAAFQAALFEKRTQPWRGAAGTSGLVLSAARTAIGHRQRQIPQSMLIL